MAESVLSFAFKARNADEAKTAIQQLKDALDQLEKEAKDAGKSLDSVGGKGKGAGGMADEAKKLGSGIDGLVSKAGGLGGIATKLGGIAAAAGTAYLGIRTLQTVVREAVQDILDSEEATLRLGFALQQAGEYSAGAVKEFQSFADVIEGSTKHNADYVAELGGMIASLGKLGGETLQRATKAVLDFSTQTGLGAETIGRLIARIAATGEARGIEQLGLKIDKTKRGAELLNDVLGAMEQAAGGASEAAAAGLSGAFVQASEAAKGLAGDIARAFNLDEVLDRAVRSTTAAVNAMRKKIGELGGETPDGLAQALEAYRSTLAQYTTAVGEQKRVLEEALLVAQKDIETEIDLRVKKGNLDTLVRDLEEIDQLRERLAREGLLVGSGDLDRYLTELAVRLGKGLQARVTFERGQVQTSLKEATGQLQNVTLEMRIEGTEKLRETEARLAGIQKRIEEAQQRLQQSRNLTFDIGAPPDLSDIATGALASVPRDLKLERQLIVNVTTQIGKSDNADEINKILEELEKRLADTTDAAERNAAKLGEALSIQAALTAARQAAAERLPKLPDQEAKIKVLTDEAAKDLDTFTKAVQAALAAVNTPAALQIDTEQALRAADGMERVKLAAEAIGPALSRAAAEGNVAGLVATYQALEAAIKEAGEGQVQASQAEIEALQRLQQEAKAALDSLIPLQAAQRTAIDIKLAIQTDELRDAELLLITLRQTLAEDPLNIPLKLLITTLEDDLERAKDEASKAGKGIEAELGKTLKGAAVSNLGALADNVFGSMINQSDSAADAIENIFKNMVDAIVKELAKLAAAKLFSFVLNLIAPGAGSFIGGLFSVAPAPQQGLPTEKPSATPPPPTADPTAVQLQLAAADLSQAALLLPTAASEIVEGILLAQRGERIGGNVYIDALEPSDFESYMLKRGAAVVGELSRTGRL